MSPSLEEPVVPVWPQYANSATKIHASKPPVEGTVTEVPPSPTGAIVYEPGRTPVVKHDDSTYAHNDLKPRFPDIKWPAIPPIPYEDRGLKGDPQFKNLLRNASDVFDYNPKIGTEIHGVRLAELDEAQKDDLARLVATRGVVFFRNQDDWDIEKQRDFFRHYGTLHKHATTSVPRKEGLEDVHVVYTSEDAKDMRAIFAPSFLWHSDVTYEVQPLAYTALKVLAGPNRGGGGDTLWSSQYAAYDMLSSQMQKYLEGLTALHSADMQADGSRSMGRPVRREPVTTEHPLIRVHPVTGWKALFFNPGFITKIVGVPKIESDYIMRYLNEVVSTTQEMNVRFQWNPNDVAMWDNRIVNHTASYGFAGNRRHAVRVGIQGERPVFDPNGTSQEEYLHEKYGVPKVSKDCCGLVNYND